MEKIPVVHLITKLELGGAQVNTIYTYENLDETKFEVYLLSGPGGILTDRVAKKDRLVIVPDLVREINPLRDIRAFIQVRRFLKKVSPRILHTHSSKAGILGRLAAYSLGRKSRPAAVHSVHGFSFSPFQSFLKRTFYTWAEKLAARMTRHFVFVSNDDIAAAQKYRLIKDNYSRIRSGFPMKKFLAQRKDAAAVRAEYGIGADHMVCGVIAPFKAQKGLFHLVEIASRVVAKNKRVVFFMAGDGELRQPLAEALEEKGIAASFKMPGFIFDIERVVNIFDIGVSTALWEGLPQSLVQLRLKKKPVVASNIPGNREVIREDKNGFLVDVQDYDGFAEKILFLLDNPQERRRLADFNEDFSEWDADFMVRAQEKLYLSLLQAPPTPIQG